MSYTRKSQPATPNTFRGQHRFEHWYRDNQIYFLTARVKDKLPAIASEGAKAVFWDRFARYTTEFGFSPWVASLLDNHYHAVGYLQRGDNLGPMMQRLHGSVAKLVNDILECESREAGALKRPCPITGRITPFWRDAKHRDYMDGCLRNEKQGRHTYAYVLTQCRRHGICDDYRDYPHTRVYVGLETAIENAVRMNAFLTSVPYKRYQGRGG